MIQFYTTNIIYKSVLTYIRFIQSWWMERSKWSQRAKAQGINVHKAVVCHIGSNMPLTAAETVTALGYAIHTAQVNNFDTGPRKIV